MTAPASAVLRSSDLEQIEGMLVDTDALLVNGYPGTSSLRQPVHTVYVPGDLYTPDLPSKWADEARSAVDAYGGFDALCAALELSESTAAEVATRVERKLAAEPIEDLRIDFEDGYGDRGDEAEDADVGRAAARVAEAAASGQLTPFIGIRFKSFEKPTRARGLRSLDVFVSSLLDHGPLPEGLILTLPKVTTVAQVEAMVQVCERLEDAHDLPAGRLRFEVQMETPQLILGPDGTVPVAQLLHRAGGRVSSLHYGTYDYSASLGIAAEYQSMEHPAADYAKNVMQVAVAGTGVFFSDGSTNILPIGDATATEAAWRLHARLIRRSLERGIYQGWDLHPAQLPTRFIATYAFYRDGLAQATARLHSYIHRTDSGFLDEPATARALAGFVVRGLACGAFSAEEVASTTGVEVKDLTELAFPAASSSTESNPTP